MPGYFPKSRFDAGGGNKMYNNAGGNLTGYMRRGNEAYGSNRFGAGGGSAGFSNLGGYGGAAAGSSSGGTSLMGSSPSSAFGQNRFAGTMRQSNQLMNPWESGIAPGMDRHGSNMPSLAGSGGTSLMGEYRGGASNYNQGGGVQMGNRPSSSKLAMNIINAVMQSDSQEGYNQNVWNYGPPQSKMRRMDMGGGYDGQRAWGRSLPMHSPTSRKLPANDLRNRIKDTSGSQRKYSNDYGNRGGYQSKRGRTKVVKGKTDSKTVKDSAKDKRSKDKPSAKDDKDRVATEGDDDDDDDGQPATSSELSDKKSDRCDDSDKSSGDSSDDEEESEGRRIKKTSSDQENLKPNPDTYPREALKCHICDITQFPNVQAFLNHLTSKKHQNNSQVFHAKGAAVLQLLRASAKLDSQRFLMKNRKAYGKKFVRQCFKCQIETPDIRKHNKTIEHRLVDHYINHKCCNMWFHTRRELEEHRLTLNHLKVQYEKELELKEKDEEERKMKTEAGLPTDPTDMESELCIRDALRELKGTEKLLETGLSEYDPEKPQGMMYLRRITQYQCMLCWSIFNLDPKMLELHCRTVEHFCNYAEHDAKQKAMAYREKMEKKRAAEAANEEKEEDKKDDTTAEEEEDISKPVTEETVIEEGGDDGDMEMNESTVVDTGLLNENESDMTKHLEGRPEDNESGDMETLDTVEEGVEGKEDTDEDHLLYEDGTEEYEEDAEVEAEEEAEVEEELEDEEEEREEHEEEDEDEEEEDDRTH